MAVDADAHAIGRDGAVAQGFKGAAEAGAEQAADHHQHRQQAGNHHIVIFDIAHARAGHFQPGQLFAQIGEKRFGERNAQRPVGQEGHFIDQNGDNGAESERDHRQIRPGDPQCRQCQNGAEAGRHQHAQWQRRPEAPIQLKRQHPGGIGADAEQRGMAQRDFAGIAEHDIQPEGDDGEDRHHHHQVQVIRAGEHERERHQGRHPSQAKQFAHPGQTFLIAVRPNSPAGFSDSTSSSSTRPGTSL